MRSTHFQYAIIYVVITFFVLLFLNIYCSKISQELFYKSKESSMIERCQMTASEIIKLDVINTSTVSNTISKIGSLRVTRIIITDHNGVAIYDSLESESSLGKYIILPEVTQALSGNDIFSWTYRDGIMRSHAATPIMSYGALLGCIYMTEYDTQQGLLIDSLQRNILWITLTLEMAVIIFSVCFSSVFTKRLRRITTSMRTIRSGDYSHKVEMGGKDELTLLGDEFNDLIERLQISENKRRQFVSDASHELKTPLASIKLLTDSILQNQMDSDTIREFVEDIGDEAERLNRMSHKLLSLSKIESQADSDCEIVPISPTVQKVVRMLSAIAAENNVRIIQNFICDSPILVLEDDLYQIVFNLVENGIKYNVHSGSLTITLDREDDNAIMTVEDCGVGIPEDSLSHIFERFYRVDKARSRKSGGSGLGLSIVRSLVERNRGEISVESTVGQGTIFRVTFPVFDPEEVDQ